MYLTDPPEGLHCSYNYSSTESVSAPDVISVIQGRPPFSITCKATSSPLPQLTWTGSVYSGWLDGGNGVLTVQEVTTNQSHSFTFRVQNEMIRTFGGRLTGNLSRVQQMHVLCNFFFSTVSMQKKDSLLV